MKTKLFYLVVILACLGAGFAIGGQWELSHHTSQPVVDLPEEYKAINKDTYIQGYYENDTLHIEFNDFKVEPQYVIEWARPDKFLVQIDDRIITCHFDELMEVIGNNY